MEYPTDQETRSVLQSLLSAGGVQPKDPISEQGGAFYATIEVDGKLFTVTVSAYED